MSNDKIKNYYNFMSSLPLNDSRFIDPLFLQYHTNKEVSPLKYPLSINTGYPKVDPYRRSMGKGLSFRSKYRGYCPPGYINKPDKNSNINTNMCYPLDEENDMHIDRTKIPNNVNITNVPPLIGTFYSNIQDSQNPKSWNFSYGQTQNSPLGYGSTPYNASVSMGSYGCKLGDLRSVVGRNENERLELSKCMTTEFW